MSFRIEEKLLIGTDQILEFKDFLMSKSAKQIYHPRIIKSLYFENSHNEMYEDSIEGITPRKKIRVRNYPEDKNSTLYLEFKISSVEGRFKTRKIIDKENFRQIKKIGINDNQYGLCKPLINVVYRREYYQMKDTRISIDEDIKFSLYSGRNLGREHSSIVEIKASINKDLDDLVNDFPFQRIRFSKYCIGFEKI